VGSQLGDLDMGGDPGDDMPDVSSDEDDLAHALEVIHDDDGTPPPPPIPTFPPLLPPLPPLGFDTLQPAHSQSVTSPAIFSKSSVPAPQWRHIAQLSTIFMP